MEKMTFISYFSFLNELAKAFKEEVIAECGISEPTFYRYLKNPEQMPKLVKEKIQEIAKKYNKKLAVDINILFPEA